MLRRSWVSARGQTADLAAARCSDILYAEYKVLYRRNFQDGLCRPPPPPEKRAEWLNARCKRNIPSVLPITPENRIPFCLFILRRYASHCAPKAPIRDSDLEEKRIFRRSVTVVSVVSACIANSHRIEKEWNFPPASRANTNAFVIRVRAERVTRLCIPKAPVTRMEKIPPYIWKATITWVADTRKARVSQIENEEHEIERGREKRGRGLDNFYRGTNRITCE